MNKGIVMDIQKRSIVVLTPDGEFITCKRKPHSYMIGQEVSFNKQEQRAARFSLPSLLKPASLLVACFLCVFLFLYNKSEEKALAYVSIDINPSLEASVTKDLRVTELRACNEDGKRILKEMKQWKNQPLRDVVRAVVKQSEEDGYLTDEKQVMLTSVAKEKTLEPQLEQTMQGLKNEYDTKHITVVYVESTMEMRENARRAGVSTGVYIKREKEKKQQPVTEQPSPAPAPAPAPALPEQVEQPPQVNSQPDLPPNSSPPVEEERHEKKEQKENPVQQPPQSERNNGHQEENKDKDHKKEDKDHEKEDKHGPPSKQEEKEKKKS